ncbi:ATP12-domain-containing protein [Hesseltinella vesiculosa]|uniref:ATP12-domain-containing protein n=1 Tax=Hesseltinella vesiculosa TaxID=101127 RepID=A0A1X2GGI2_9FUNG|nr:ATP12-domain-containing protein [Hesseltinella vesiculosa]
MKRFWKKAGIKEDKDGVTVKLDQRNLRTPSKNVITLSPEQRYLALLTAAEWDAQTKVLKPHTLPLTSVISRAIDGLEPKNNDRDIRPAVVDKLMTYFDTDATCYHEDYPEALVKLQDQYWTPVIDWVSKKYNVDIQTTKDIFAVQQPEETKAKLRQVVENMDPLELAAFERAVMSSKSFLIGLALIKHGISVEQAAQAAQVESNSQMERWGEVEDSHDVEREHIRQTLGSAALAVLHKK